MKRSRIFPFGILLMFLGLLVLIPPYVPNNNLHLILRSTRAQPTHFVANTTTGPATVECYTSPDTSFNVTLKYLRQAQDEILMTMYAISNGFLLKELADALARNGTMVIHVIVSRNWASGSENHWTHASLYNISSLPGYGVNVFAYKSRSDLLFTHAKYIIIDREVVLVQSANWAKSGVPPHPSDGNREWGVAIQNSDVVDYFLNVFGSDVSTATPYVQDGGDYDFLSSTIYTGPYPYPFANQTFTGTMTITSLVSPDHCIPAIVNLIDSATSTLDVQQMYSKADWDGYANQFNDAIISAVGRGVHCRVMLDNRSSGMQPVADMLKSYGVHVAFTNQTYFGWTHNKGVIVDGQSVLISSINWSNESVSRNREAAVIITHSGVANFFAQVFQWDWENGEYLGVPPAFPTLSGPSTTDTGLVALSWTVSTSETDIDHYQVQASNTSNFNTIIIQVNRTTKTYTADITAFGSGTYYFRVRAVYNNDTTSGWSNVITTTYTAPPPPIPIEYIIIGAVITSIIIVAGYLYKRYKK